MSDSNIVLEKKSIFSIFWFIALILGVVLAIHLWYLRNEAIARAKSETVNIANALKEYTVRQISTTDILLAHQLQSPLFEKALREKDEKLLHLALQKMQQFQDPPAEYFLLDEKGELLASSRNYPVQKENLKGTPFFNFHRENTEPGIHVGHVLRVHTSQDPLIPLTKRVSSGDGRFVGVIGMFLDPRTFQSFYKSLTLEENDSVVLFDENGNFVMRFPWREGVVGSLKTRNEQIVTSVYNQSSGTTIGPGAVDGKLRVLGYTKLENRPLIAVIGRLMSDINVSLWKAFLFLVPIYIGLVILSFYLLRAFLASEDRLKRGAERALFFESTVKSIHTRTSPDIGQKYLNSLVLELGKTLGFRYVFVGELSEDRKWVKTLASSQEGKLIPNMEYALADSPCEGVLNTTICFFNRQVKALFPKDQLLVQMGAESYLGVALFDSRGKPLGLLVAIHDAPMEDSDVVATIFTIFATKAGAEIERMRSEKSRQESEEIRHRLESQILQSAKMESMGRLASGIAHDFNNVLAAITANLEYAKLKASDQSASLDYIERAEKASVRARDLVRQILTFGRKGSLENAPLDLPSLIQEVAQILRAGVGAHIEIRTSILDDDIRILGNATQIHQVLMNLCTNAAQALSGRSGLIELILEKDGEEAALRVKDNGVGIPPDVLPRIFEPFFTMKNKGQGTGLGLAVVNSIVKGHGGRIEVHSVPDKGSEFVLHFPLYKRPAEKAPALAKLREIPTGGGQNILVVDDESTMVELTCEILNDQGYQATGFTFPQQAYQAFLGEPEKYCLIVTDLTMPGMHGEELVRRIRDVRPDIPVIFTTGLDTELNALKEISGPYVTLQKPYNLWVLVEAVGKFLKNPAKFPESQQ